MFFIVLLGLSISACSDSDTETSESLKEKYGLAPTGVEVCDSYLNKLRNCLDKAPPKKHPGIVNIYTFVVSDMTNFVQGNSPNAKQIAIEACRMGSSQNRAAMVSMGCDW